MADVRKQPALTPRLRMVAGLVRPGARVADVGTDHALLPVWLVQTGRCPRCVACDVREGPLGRARLTLEAYGVRERVPLRLSDGLAAVEPGEADDVVMAGMGGELIARLVEACPWLRDGAKQLILQPMTAQPELRAALCRMGFTIEREVAAREGGRLYMAMEARYAGAPAEPSALFLLTGRLAQNRDDVSRAFLLREAKLLRAKAQGQKESGRLSAQAARNEALASAVEALARQAADGALG